MTVDEVKAYCNQQGVPYTENSKGVIVHDMTSVSGVVRAALNEHGFIAKESVTPAEPKEE